MAFFSIFLAWFFIFLFTSGLAGIACGIIGLIITANKRRAGTPLPKVLNVIFPIVLSIGITLAMIPVSLFSLVFIDSIVSATEEESFVQTDITIDEAGYQDEKFTADGVKYSVLDFTLTYEDDDVDSEPIFTYKGGSLLNMWDCGNYCAVENEQGFDLVSDGCGTLFCPDSQREEIIEYYTDVSNFNAYYDDWDESRFKLSKKDKKTVEKLMDTDIDSLPEKRIALEDAEEFVIELESSDELLYVNTYNFLIFNKKLYVVEDWDYDEDDNCIYVMKKLPEDIADAILKIHNLG